MKKYLLAEDTINDLDFEDLITWLKTKPWLTQGPLVREFEASWAAWMGSKHALFVNSGSSANLLMVYALKISGRLKNSKVIVPAVSWSTTVAPVIQLGLEPILCESDPETWGLDPSHLEILVKKENPAAVMAVHVLGVPCLLDPILKLQQKYGFHFLEDACAATGSSWNGKRIGSFGIMGSYSFFFGHHLSTIEGGMVVTDDEELYDVLLQVRSHGWAKDLERSKQLAQFEKTGDSEFRLPFTFYYPGFNLRSSDLNARIGLSQMKRIDSVVSKRMENHKTYQDFFANHPDFKIQKTAPGSQVCSIAFGVMAPSVEARDQIGKRLMASGIETRPLGGGNMSRQPFWSRERQTVALPFADQIHDRAFQLPNHPGLETRDILVICDEVLSVLA